MGRVLTVLLMAVTMTACGACAPSMQKEIETTFSDGKYDPPKEDTAQCRAAVQQLESHAPVPIKRLTSEQIIEILGYEVAGALMRSADGKVIILRDNFTACGELEVLAHEIAHVYDLGTLTSRERQVFADMVSYHVVRELGGYDPRARYVKYLSSMKLDARLISIYEREIQRTVGWVMNGKPTDQ